LSQARETSLHLDEPLRDFLQTRYWPGNVRQLHSCLADMVALAKKDTLTLADVPPTVRSDVALSEQTAVPTNTRLDDVERMAVLQALRLHDGNRTHAAKALGISVRTLQRRLRSWSVAQSSEEMPWPKTKN
jgi:transcriptional regulator of acetoin/glycerol metabolism